MYGKVYYEGLRFFLIRERDPTEDDESDIEFWYNQEAKTMWVFNVGKWEKL